MSGWYLNRLKTMSVAEILYRTRQYCRKQYDFLVARNHPPVSELMSVGKNILFTELKAETLFDDHISIFGKDFYYTEADIDWHKDIFSSQSFPLAFSKSINIRSNPEASAKNVWEINRLQFLLHLAINFRISGDEIYLNRFTSVLDSWIRLNPYLTGVNWYSNIEVNIRLINWYFCWQILDVEGIASKNSSFREFVEKKWVPAIYRHCYYSFHNPSKFSSANNHLISEYAGLFIAASFWKFRESDRWLKYSVRGLEKEIRAQHSSGVNKEEAAEYIQFITDFFLLSYVVAERSGMPFSSGYKEELKAIFTYINSFLDCAFNFPKYGDEDDGKCIMPGHDEKFNNFRSLLTSAAIIFNEPLFKKKSNGFDLKNNLLFGEEGRSAFDSIPFSAMEGQSAFYKNEGHFIFRKADDRNEIYLHFDAAPLGFLSIAAHGHADALSFMLNVDGNPVFIDPGTYTYHTEPLYRHYFIGTLAHNTIRINEHDQALNGGPTLWLKHYAAVVESLEAEQSTERVVASHNGYAGEGVSHTREVIFHRMRNEFEITDTLNIEASGRVIAEIPFHIHPSILISAAGNNKFILSGTGTRKTEFRIDEKLNPITVKGQTSPVLLGWYSASFMKKEPCQVIYCKSVIERTTSFKYYIKIE